MVDIPESMHTALHAMQALKRWLQALQPGGAAAVCFWPTDCEAEGPWHAYDQARC
jgi:uncharacterized protein YdeI (YjbR/CyaY-like superfamily)